MHQIGTIFAGTPLPLRRRSSRPRIEAFQGYGDRQGLGRIAMARRVGAGESAKGETGRTRRPAHRSQRREALPWGKIAHPTSLDTTPAQVRTSSRAFRRKRFACERGPDVLGQRAHRKRVQQRSPLRMNLWPILNKWVTRSAPGVELLSGSQAHDSSVVAIHPFTDLRRVPHPRAHTPVAALLTPAQEVVCSTT